MTLNYARVISKLIGAANPLTPSTLRQTTNTGHSATLGAPIQTVNDYDCDVNLGPASDKFNGNLTRIGDLHATLAAENLEFTPHPGDTLFVGGVVGGTTYSVVDINPLYTGSEAIMYTMLVRK